MRVFLIALMTLLLLPFAAIAQTADRPNTILVLDGSGSMWGQIDGVNKIVIARNVIAEMLSEMADDVSLGLTVYGHRERGSCGDIETIVPPAPFTQDRILEAVNSINPRGRTPMTDAVIAAAQSLRHTEEAATVILVSDGIENCNPDPCAIAAELDATGVDFTAHVIGFDVASEPEARAQMQCIADNTGGQFLTADNAAELSAALEQVVAIVPTAMRLEAQILPQGNLPTRPVTWTLLGADGGVVSANVPGPAIDVQLFPGTYVAQATRVEPNGPQTYQTSFNVIEGQTDLIVVAMPPIIETAPMTFTARVEPDMSVPASQLAWTLFDASGATLLGPVVAPGGNVALLPGDYRLVVERSNTGTRHEATFTMESGTPQEVIIPLPALAVDITFVARIGDVGGVTITDPVIFDVSPLNSNPVTTNPATFVMGRGAYRVTAYWTVQEIEQTLDFVVVDQPREIIVVFPEPAATAVLTATATAPVASDVEVAWDGPGDPGDMIMINDPETGRLLSVVIVNTNPISIVMPAYPGPYEITYRQNGGNGPVIGSTTIQVTDATATLTAPDTVEIGTRFDVAWDGPGYQQDRIALVPVGESAALNNGRALLFGNPLELTAPPMPGQYELHYILRAEERVIGTRPVEVVDVQATITAPATAVAGSTIDVGWTGPANDRDFIGITEASIEADRYNRFANTTRIEDGNPLGLLMPTEPGEYVLEYVLREGGLRVVAVPITVTEAAATLTAPSSAIAGSSIEVGWTGPGYDNDFIGITAIDAEGYNRFANTTRISDGTPLDLLMPTEPGDYVIEYVVGQDRPRLVSVPITVTEAAATLTAPSSAIAGSSIEVGWTGPGYDNDFIGITAVDAEGYNRFANTTRINEGTPLDLLMPTEPGDYVIEYVVGQDRPRLVSVPITITDSVATLTAPATALAGSSVEIGWTGPGYDNDFIGITRVGVEGYNRFSNTTRTRDGSPLQLLMPTETGEYVIEYVVGQDRSNLVTVPISVTDASATLTAPVSAIAGSAVEIGWTGPGYENDFIGITRVGVEGYNRFSNTTRTRDGSPLDLLMPTEPGEYLLEYVLGQDRTTLVSQPMSVTEPGATLTAPATAIAGQSLEIGWTGPGYDNDFIGITEEGVEGYHRFANTTRTNEGSPLQLLMPTEPGAYVLEYVLGQDRTNLVRTPITVTAAQGTITAPASAAAGSQVEIGFTGPGYPNDFIGISPARSDSYHRFEDTQPVADGSPVTLTMPATPGTYQLEYVFGQDRTALTQVSIAVEVSDASITAPANAVAGDMIEVAWTGPNAPRDYIGIGRVGATGAAAWQTFGYTADGSLLTIQVPIEAGTYEISYFSGANRETLVTVPLTVTDVVARVTAPASAPVGSTIQIGWSGPDYDDDYIGIGRPGAVGVAAFEQWTYTAEGTTLDLVMPSTPGTYVIAYYARQDRQMLGSVQIELTPVQATVTAPATAIAGSTIEVAWTGPDYADDYIGIGRVGSSSAAQWQEWTYTAEGSPLMIEVPDEPGEYELRYFMRLDRTELVSVPLTVQ